MTVFFLFSRKERSKEKPFLGREIYLARPVCLHRSFFIHLCKVTACLLPENTDNGSRIARGDKRHRLNFIPQKGRGIFVKKLFLLFLVLAVVCCGMPSFAAAYTYSGVWIDFSFYGFSLYMPSAWYQYEAGDVSYLYGNRRGTQMMIIDIDGSDYYSLAGLYRSMSENTAFSDVQYVTLNNVDFIAYDMPGSDAYGVVTLSNDCSLIYYFEFSPYNDAELTEIANQIMGSIVTYTPSYGQIVITGGNGINVRAGGGTEYRVLCKVNYGEVYDVVDISLSGWYGLELTDGSIGYISPKVCTFVY